MDEQIKVSFVGDASGLNAASQQSVKALDGVSKATAQVSQSLANASSAMAQNAGKLGGALDHVANRSSTARFAVQNLSNVVRDIPFGINNPAIFSTALDHVVASMTMLKQEAAAMSAETGVAQTGFGLLKQSLSGGGGLLIGFNIVSVAATFLAQKLMGATAAEDELAKKTKETKERIAELTKSMSEIKIDIRANVAGDTSGEITKVQALAKVVEDQTKSYTERNRALTELKDINKNYFGDLSIETDKLGILATRVDEYTKALIAASVVKAFAEDIGKVGKELSQQGDKLGDLRQQLNDLTGDYKHFAAGEGSKGIKFLSKDQEKQAEALRKQIQEQEPLVVALGNTYKKLQGQIEGAVQATLQFKPLEVKGETKGSKEGKSSFLFDFLPFNPNGTLKPEQKEQLLEAIDKFQKEFGNIFKGAVFTGTEAQRITQAKEFDLELKAGKVKFNTDSLKEAFQKLNKDSDIIPKDSLEEISKEAVDQFIRGFQNESERVKGLNLFGGLTTDFTKDLGASVDLLKTRAKQFGVAIPKLFQATNIFGKPVVVSLEDLFDTSKISNDDAIKAIRNAMQGVTDEATKDIYGFNAAVSSVASEAFASIGEGIAAALSGNDIGSVFKQFESFLGSAVEALGKKIVELNVAALLLKKALKLTFTNPAIGIAAGIGLVAIGAALKSLAGGGIKGFAKGGIVPGSGIGDTVPAMLTPGEYVVPKWQMPEFMKWLNGQNTFSMPRISNGMLGFASGGFVPNSVDRNSNAATGAALVQVPYIAGFDISHDKMRLLLKRANNYGDIFGR